MNMGLGIELQNEWSGSLESVADPKNLLSRLLPADDDWSQPMLASIDFYGDTIFNRVQIPRFLLERATVSTKAETPEESSLVKAIERMALRCRDEVHMYLRFIGD
jgi:hypothetical protein